MHDVILRGREFVKFFSYIEDGHFDPTPNNSPTWRFTAYLVICYRTICVRMFFMYFILYRFNPIIHYSP